MKKNLLLTLIGIFLTLTLQAQTTKKVLFLGNSYTYFYDMPEMTAKLALASGDTLIYSQSTPGGYNLMQHTTNNTSIYEIKSNDWDHVILQDHSLRPSYYYLDFYNGAEQLIQIINKNTPCLNKTIFYMTWGRDSSLNYPYNANYPYYEHQELVTEAYNSVANIFGTEVAPIGAAWKKIRDENDPINLYDKDGNHPSYAGSYLTACVFYATIFDKSPVGLSFNGTLSTEDATYLQEKAFEAYEEYVALNLIHTEMSADSVTNVYRAKLNHSRTELDNLIGNDRLNTTFDFTYTGFSETPEVNTTLEYVIHQNDKQIANNTLPISMTIPTNKCVNQTATFPLNVDLTNVEEGVFRLVIFLNGKWIASYALLKDIINSTIENENEELFYIVQHTGSKQIEVQSDKEIKELVIQDSMGKIILTQNISSWNTLLNIAHLPKGLYILQAQLSDKVVVRRFAIH